MDSEVDLFKDKFLMSDVGDPFSFDADVKTTPCYPLGDGVLFFNEGQIWYMANGKVTLVCDPAADEPVVIDGVPN